MFLLKSLPSAAISAAILALFAVPAAATPCSSLDATASYSSFGSCTASGNDTFASVSSIVSALFIDEGISITQAGSYSSGPGTAGEFFGDDLSAGFDIVESGVSGNDVFNFVSLPNSTLFVTIKQRNGYELFGIPASGTPFSLAHSLGGGSTSHISTFAGTGIEIASVPLPAGGTLLLAGLGGLAVMRRRASA